MEQDLKYSKTQLNTSPNNMVEIKIQVGGDKKTGWLSKLTHFIFGIFLTSVIFAVYMQLWQEKGIVFAFATTILIAILSYYHSEPKTFLRRLTWGIISTIIAIIISYLTLMKVFQFALEGL